MFDIAQKRVVAREKQGSSTGLVFQLTGSPDPGDHPISLICAHVKILRQLQVC
jgi:hypothetical protein